LLGLRLGADVSVSGTTASSTECAYNVPRATVGPTPPGTFRSHDPRVRFEFRRRHGDGHAAVAGYALRNEAIGKHV